jgi:hypothetical protein
MFHQYLLMSKDTNTSLVFMFFLLIPSLFSDVVHFHRCMNFNELLLIPTDARCFSNTSFKYVPSMCVRYCSSFSTNVQQCPLILMDVHHFQNLLQAHSKAIPNAFPNHSKRVPKPPQVHFKGMPRPFLMHFKAVPGTFQSHSKVIPKPFPKYPKAIPSTFRSHSKGIPKQFQVHSKSAQTHPKAIPKGFQRHSKYSPTPPQRHSKATPKAFQSIPSWLGRTAPIYAPNPSA